MKTPITENLSKINQHLGATTAVLPQVLRDFRLEDHRARVALCLDVSATMHPLYRSGKMQTFAERVLALGVFFDENDAIDIFLFGDKTHYVGQMNLLNFKDFIPKAKQKYISTGATQYSEVFAAIRKFYFPDAAGGARAEALLGAELPVYAMFVSDGTTLDEASAEQQLAWSSYEPIFWQFMAIGKNKEALNNRTPWGWISRAFAHDFSFFQKLDDLTEGCKLDNADFFCVADPQKITDQELYQHMMNEYPEWLQTAHTAGLIV
ncbi:MAG: VWA domain-containing protein [Bernardetiaceae bacterium]